MPEDNVSEPAGSAGTAEKTQPVNLVSETPEQPTTPVPPPQPPKPPVPPVPPTNQPVGQQPSGEPGKLRGIGQLFKDAFSVYKRGWKELLYYALISIVLIIAVILIGLAMVFLGLKNIILLVVLVVILIIAVIIISLIMNLALKKLVYGIAEGNNEGLKAAFRYAKGALWGYLGVSILTGLAVAGPLLAFILLAVFLGFSGVENIALIIVAAVAVGIPALLVMLYLGVKLSLAEPSYIVDNIRRTAALKNSWGLVKGHFWRVFLRYFILFLIAILIGLVQPETKVITIWAIILYAIYTVLQYFYTIFATSWSYYIYRDLSNK